MPLQSTAISDPIRNPKDKVPQHDLLKMTKNMNNVGLESKITRKLISKSGRHAPTGLFVEACEKCMKKQNILATEKNV